MIFYEAPHKLRTTLDDLAETFGTGRPMALCRELTKLHEEILRFTIGEAVERYANQEPRGEFVLVIAGCPPQIEEGDEAAAIARAGQLRQEGMPLKQAAAQAAEEFGVKKRWIYNQITGKENE